MKLFGWSQCLLAFLLSGQELSGQESKPLRPHVLLIVADDLGLNDVGWRGSAIETPTLDALAKVGTRLERYYSMQMCTPARAALLTGRHPMRFGMQSGVIHPGMRAGLPANERTLAEWLQSSGYTTAIFGKWHLGHAQREFWPTHRGFDHFVGGLLGESDYFTRERESVSDWWKDEKPIVQEGYTTTLIGQEAASFVRSHDPAQPLFLYLPFTAPHAPFQAPKEFLDRYSEWPEPRRTYAAMVTALDAAVAEVLLAFREKSMLANTLVIFVGDNGGVPDRTAEEGEEEEEEEEESPSSTPADNGPFRGGKGSFKEGGLRTPAFACWPERVAAQSVDVPVHVTDWCPTLLALAGIKVDRPLDGENLWPLLTLGRPLTRTKLLLNLEAHRGAIVEGPWKLVVKGSAAHGMLYNLDKDPAERNDVARSQPERVKELLEEIRRRESEEQPSILKLEIRSEGIDLDRAVFPTDDK